MSKASADTLSLLIKENESSWPFFTQLSIKRAAFAAHYLEHKAGVRYLCLIATLSKQPLLIMTVYLMLWAWVAKQLKRNSVTAFYLLLVLYIHSLCKLNPGCCPWGKYKTLLHDVGTRVLQITLVRWAPQNVKVHQDKFFHFDKRDRLCLQFLLRKPQDSLSNRCKGLNASRQVYNTIFWTHSFLNIQRFQNF